MKDKLFIKNEIRQSNSFILGIQSKKTAMSQNLMYYILSKLKNDTFRYEHLLSDLYIYLPTLKNQKMSYLESIIDVLKSDFILFKGESDDSLTFLMDRQIFFYE